MGINTGVVYLMHLGRTVYLYHHVKMRSTRVSIMGIHNLDLMSGDKKDLIPSSGMPKVHVSRGKYLEMRLSKCKFHINIH